jgi:3-dehydroquinate dehydratase-1
MLSIGTTYLDGAPRVVLALRDAEDLTEVARFASRGVDVLEARIDQFTQTDAAYVQGYLARLRPFPLLGTIRYAAEGGGWTASEAEREALFRAILPSVDAVDIELGASIRDAVIASAHAAGRLVLGSFHDFEGMPSRAVLDAKVAEGDAAGVDVVKIAVTCHDTVALQNLAEFTLAHRHRPLVTIGMGAAGAASRIFFPALGSLLTYTFLGEPTAPGQLTCEETLHYLTAFYPSRMRRAQD